MAALSTFAEIQAYLASEGIQDVEIHDEPPDVILCVKTPTELTDTQKNYIRDNTPIFVHLDFCVG